MTNEEKIKENNKLIAEFMGDEPEIEYTVSNGSASCLHPKINGFSHPLEQKRECDAFLEKNRGQERLLNYRTTRHEWYPYYPNDWNKLMSVVDKIEKLGYEFVISRRGVQVVKYNMDANGRFEATDMIIDDDFQSDYIGAIKRDSVYECVVCFINMHNKKENGYKRN